MAIFHMSVQVISRADGRSAVAASAYRAGEKLRDERLCRTFDYRKKSEVSFRVIYGPKSAPEWMGNRARLWNEVERTEKRKDAQLAREIEVALPKELTHAKQIVLLKEFLSHYFVEQGMIVDVALHDKGSGNPHAHILATMREVVGDGFGKKRREWNSTEYLESIRLGWAACVNHHLRRAGWRSTIDHRSLVEQGIDRPATVHEGPKRRAMRKKGIANEAATHNKKIEEEIQMTKDNKPCLAPKRAPKPLLEVYENAVFLD